MPVLAFGAGIYMILVQSDYLKSLVDFSDPNTLTYNSCMLVFFAITILMSVLSFIKNYSLIPVLGLVSCCYLMTGIGTAAWKWFFIWFAIGLVIYAIYGYKKSKLAPHSSNI